MSVSFEKVAIRYLAAKQLASGTCKEYRGTVAKWLAWGRGPNVDRIGRSDIREFLDWVHEKAAADGGSNAGRTANKARENVRAILSWAWEQDYLEKLPRLPKPKPQRDVAGRHYLTKADLNALYFATYPYTTQVWQGEHVSVLTPVNDASRYDPPALLQMVVGLDRGYEYCEAMTGQRPIAWDPYTHNGRATIAAVESTCGAACGYLGWNGIEIQNSYFQSFHDGVRDADQFAQFPFYELGRNFWFYENQLTTPGSDPAGLRSDPMSAVTGYAVAMGFLALDASGVQGGPFCQWTYEENKAVIAGLIDAYAADEGLSFSEAFSQGVDFSQNQLGGADLFASVLFRLEDDFGTGFVGDLWREVEQRPDAQNDQEAIDNFFLAASHAADTDLGQLFRDDWRWPVSASALAEAALLGLDGDYNGDGVVDAADYTVWRDTVEQADGRLAADGNGDGLVDDADYDVWRDNFGRSRNATSQTTSNSVPEPNTALLTAVVIAILYSTSQRRMRSSAWYAFAA